MDSRSPDTWTPLLDVVRRTFGDRYEALVAYGRSEPASSLVLVSTIDADDLDACARALRGWRRDGGRTPLFVTTKEFARSLDAFPLEYAEVQQTARIVDGYNPFERFGSIRRADLRRACEVQANSHLLHIREDYLETGGHPRDVAALVAESAPAFAMILRQLAQLDGRSASTPLELGTFAAERIGMDPGVVGDILALLDVSEAGTVDAARLFPRYLTALDRLARFVDQWSEP